MPDLGQQLANLMRSLEGEIEDPKELGKAFAEAMKEMFPDATHHDVLRAKKITEEDRRAEKELADAEMAELERMLTFLAKHNIPSGTPFNEAVATVAATGDTEAIGFLSEMNDPQHRAWLAVFDAAVDAHPDWERDEQGPYACCADEGPQRTPESLVDWFQMTFPKEARAIEDRIQREGGT